MKRTIAFVALLMGAYVLAGIGGCGSDPNVEGAKLDLRNRDYDRALSNLETALENNPENAEAWKYRGIVYQAKAEEAQNHEERTQHIEQMMEAYDRALELDPGEAGDITGRLQMAWIEEYQRGLDAFERGQDDSEAYERAASHFRNSTLIEPDSVYGYINQGYALIAAGRATDAIEPLEQAIQHGDDSIDTRLYLAELYFSADRPLDAVELLEQARTENPESEEILTDLLNAYIRTDMLDRAMETFGEAVEAEPENRLFRYNYGSLLLQADQYDEAIEQLEMAIELDPTYANAWYNLGAAYQNKAVHLNDEREELEDRIRAERATLSDQEEAAIQAEIDQKNQEMRDQFSEAVPPLERAKELMEQSGDDPTDVCQALFRAYVQTNNMEQAQAVADCANIEID